MSIPGGNQIPVSSVYGKTPTQTPAWGGPNLRYGDTNPGVNAGYAAQAMPGTPAGYQQGFAATAGTPFSSNPNQYGRWNWAAQMPTQPQQPGQPYQPPAQPYQPPPIGINDPKPQPLPQQPSPFQPAPYQPPPTPQQPSPLPSAPPYRPPQTIQQPTTPQPFVPYLPPTTPDRPAAYQPSASQPSGQSAPFNPSQFPAGSQESYDAYAKQMASYLDYAKSQGLTDPTQYRARLDYQGLNMYGNGDPAAAYKQWTDERAKQQAGAAITAASLSGGG